MKKLMIILITAAICSSCSPGRWVGGNAKHMQQRHDAKLLKKAKSEFDNKKQR